MLTYLKNGQAVPLDWDDYYIQEEWFGADDTLAFTLPDQHPQLADMVDQLELTDKESGQAFLITSTDEGDIKAKIDLDAFKAEMYVPYTNDSTTVVETITGVLPGGWTVRDTSGSSIRRTIKLDGATALDIIRECPDTYGVAIRFFCSSKEVRIYSPDDMAPTGTYFSDELNLRKNPVRSTSTKNFATRLYAYGKDGMSFADINNGKPYVDNHEYSERVVSAYWSDDRYTIAENLLADAKAKLAEMAKPAVSYECDVADLAKVDPETWGHLTVGIYRGVILMDRVRGGRMVHRVARYKRYPHHPDHNVVTLSTVPGTMSGKVEQSYNAVTNPNSGFQQIWKGFVTSLVDGIAGYDGGNLIITKNAQGKPNGIMIMDTEDQATARKILWINLKGILYSAQGMAGFDDPDLDKITVWSFDRNGFYANWLVAGTIDASIVRVINLIADHLTSRSGTYMLDIWAAVMKLMDGENQRVSIYTTGVKDSAGIVQVFAGTQTEDGKKDETTRYSYLYPYSIGVGEKQDGTYEGAVHAGSADFSGAVNAGSLAASGTVIVGQDVSAGGSVTARGNIRTEGTILMRKVAPIGSNELTVDWVRINTADGGTAWALCGM